MSDRRNRDTESFVPPTPPAPKVAGSHDNPLEMAAGGENEREAGEVSPPGMPSMANAVRNDARGDTTVRDMEAAPAAAAMGRTDNPLGTGVGYAGEGAISYGTQGATGDDLRLDEITAPSAGGNTSGEVPTSTQGHQTTAVAMQNAGRGNVRSENTSGSGSTSQQSGTPPRTSGGMSDVAGKPDTNPQNRGNVGGGSGTRNAEGGSTMNRGSGSGTSGSGTPNTGGSNPANRGGSGSGGGSGSPGQPGNSAGNPGNPGNASSAGNRPGVSNPPPAQGGTTPNRSEIGMTGRATGSGGTSGTSGITGQSQSTPPNRPTGGTPPPQQGNTPNRGSSGVMQPSPNTSINRGGSGDGQ